MSEGAGPAPAGGPTDDRLVELLTALGSVEPGRLRGALDELRAARARGERVDAAAFLAERGVVPRAVLDDLLGGDEERARVGGGAAAVEEGPPRRSRKARRISDAAPTANAAPTADAAPAARARSSRRAPPAAAEDDLPAPAQPPAPAVADGPAVDEAPDAPRRSRKARRVSSDQHRPARRPSARADRPPEPVALVPPPGLDAPAAAAPTDESTGAFDLETRRFDPAALAAASAARSRGGLSIWQLKLALALALGLGGLAIAAAVRRLSREPAPPPTLDLPTPVDLEPDFEPEPETEPEPEPEPGPPVVDPWPDLVERVRALGDVERYADACALLDAAPPEVRATHAEAIQQARERLLALDAFRQAADQALREAEELRRRGKPGEAARRMQAALDAHPALAGSATARRVEAARVEALETRAEAAPTPSRAEPAERAARFAADAARGRELVHAIQARVRRDQARLGEVQRAEAARARAASERAPLDLELAPGYLLKATVISDLDERGFTARAAGSSDAIARTWATVPAEVALRVRRLAVREDVAEDQLRLGRWCLANYHFDEARQAFARAVSLDPRLLGQVPDVSEVVRAGRLFAGRLQRTGSSLELAYGFGRPAEASDFQDEPGARGVLREGRLEVRGKGSFLSALTEIGFEGRVEVKAVLGPASRDALSVAGVAFAAGTRREVAWLVAVARSSGDLLLLRRADGRVRTVDRKAGLLKSDPTAEVTLEVGDDGLRVRALRRTQLRVPMTVTWEGVRAVVGGVAPADGAGSIDALTVRGAVRPDWLRKAVGEVDAKVRAMLARTEELPVFVAPSVRPAPAALSAEDEFGLDGVPPEALEAYREGRLKAASGAPLDRLAAANAFERALELAPRFAAAAFRRALVLEALGRPHLALVDLEQAAAQCPRFYEAHAERARVLAVLGRLDDARAAADEALALRPDHAPALAARALAAFLGGDLEPALADLDVALGLDPWNDELRARRKNVVHVLAGPPWERPFRRETPHYVVETDISQRRCDEYARDLEAVRRFYVARFGLDDDPPAPPGRKARVLIFDTREGFHAYAELTTDDRVESLLGCYLPRYRQLLLYEDKDDVTLEETRRVLFHEAFHQFIHGLVGDLPYWLNEGLAEYFSSCRVEADGRVTPPDASSRLEKRVLELRRYLARDEPPVPFARLMNESPAEFYSGPVAAKYAQAWAMVHYFEHGGGAELKERFRRYVNALREGWAPRRAFQAAWAGVDWAEVQRGWLEYARRL